MVGLRGGRAGWWVGVSEVSAVTATGENSQAHLVGRRTAAKISAQRSAQPSSAPAPEPPDESG